MSAIIEAASVTTTAMAAGQASPMSNSTSLSGIIPAIQGFAASFSANVGVVMVSLDNAAIDIGTAAVVFLIIAGVILWFTRVNKHLGKELVEGGILIALFIRFAVPYLM